MKHLPAFFLFIAFASSCAPPVEQIAVTDDIENFWNAYDGITAVSDSAAQYALLDSLFIAPGTPGLRAIMQRRGYTAASYIDAINSYPRFWSSIRANTGLADVYAEEINAGVEKLRALYPSLKPARVYFTMGALMTNGMTLDDVVFIGSEVAMADSTVVTEELPGRLGQNLRAYFDSNPIEHIAFLNVHEYVHTQQGPFGETLLQVALQEGVAEFIAALATGGDSPTPAVAFGAANEVRVKARFATEMFSPNTNDWLYNNFDNAFAMRDLGYYIGYAIAERYHAQAADKAEAIATLIELDYTDMQAVERVVDAADYFPESMATMRQAYQDIQPEVLRVQPFDQVGTTDLPAGPMTLSIEFSAPMTSRFRGFDYGPLGAEHVLGIQRVIGWSADSTVLQVEVNLKPDHRHQMTLTSQFRTAAGTAIKPYLIDVKTR